MVSSIQPYQVKLRNEASRIHIVIPPQSFNHDLKMRLLRHLRAIMESVQKYPHDFEYAVTLTIMEDPDPDLLNEAFTHFVRLRVPRLFIEERCELAEEVLFRTASALSIEEFSCRLDMPAKLVMKAVSNMRTLRVLRFLPGSILPPKVPSYLHDLNLEAFYSTDPEVSSEYARAAYKSHRKEDVKTLSLNDVTKSVAHTLASITVPSLSFMFRESANENIQKTIRWQGECLKRLSFVQGPTPNRAIRLQDLLESVSHFLPVLDSLHLTFREMRGIRFSFLARYSHIRELSVQFFEAIDPVEYDFDVFQEFIGALSYMKNLQSFKLSMPNMHFADLSEVMTALTRLPRLQSITIDARIGYAGSVQSLAKILNTCKSVWKILRKTARLKPSLVFNGISALDIRSWTQTELMIDRGCLEFKNARIDAANGLPLVVPIIFEHQ